MGERAAEDRKVEGSIPSRGIFMKKENILFKITYADSFTIVNGICGLLSVLFILYSEIYFAFVFILIAVLADGMDGIMARKYGGFIGKYMDEFSDTISFCLAPCIFVFHIYEIKLDNFLFLFVSSLFLIFGMLHLVNYHIGEKNYFVGITTPASAIIVVSMSYLNLPLITVIFAMFLLSLLTISSFPYPRIEKHFAVVACIIIFLAMTGIDKFVFLLLFSTSFYAVCGPIYMNIKYSTRNF